MNSKTNRKCNVCNEVKNLDKDFYKIRDIKKEYYRKKCKVCFCKNQFLKYRDKDLLYHDNNFDDLPKEIKLSVILLCLENHNLKYISKIIKCKYNTLYYAYKSKQLENFATNYARENPNNIYGIAIKE